MGANVKALAAIAAIAAIAVFAIAVGVYLAGMPGGRAAPAPAPPPSAIGGPFSLIDTNGRTVTDATLRGKPTVMFFGFTFCPEVCPTTLADLSSDLQTLGPSADRLNVVFVSVDPERDTRQQLARYLSSFDRRIVGLTGAPEQVEAMERAYRVYARRQPLESGGYTMDHTSYVMLFDAQGRFVEPIGYGQPPERRLAALRRLLG